MSRCGCKLLTELDNERSRHQSTIDENLRCNRKIKDLHEELDILHNTVGTLEKRYSEISARYRKSQEELDSVCDTKDRLKNHSSDVADENRRLDKTCERLQREVHALQEALEAAKEETEEERRRRQGLEMSSSRDLLEVDRTCHLLRRTTSAQEIDTQHLRKSVNRLQTALEREKYRHDVTRRTYRYSTLHSPHHVAPFCHHRNNYYPDCSSCFMDL